MRKLLIALIGILLLGTVVLLIVHSTSTKGYTENSAFKCIPLRSPIVLEIPNIKELKKKITSDEEFIEILQEAQFLAAFNDITNTFASKLDADKQLSNLLKDKSILIAYNLEGNNDITPLYSFSLHNKQEENATLNYFADLASSQSLSTNEYDYENASVYSISFKNAEKYFYTVSGGIFIMSPSRLLLEEGVRQVKADNLTNHSKFKALHATVSSSSLVNVYINHKNIEGLLNCFVKPKYKNFLNNISQFAFWSELDVSSKKNEYWLNGYSAIEDNKDSYLSLFLGQKPQRFDIDEVITTNASMFLNVNLESFAKFQLDYTEHLKLDSKPYYLREARLLEIEKQYKRSFVDVFTEISENDFALVFGNVVKNEPANNRYFIAEVKSQSIAKDGILPILSRYAQSKNKELSQLRSVYRLNEREAYEIYQFPIEDCANLLLGQAFSSVSCKYVCFYDNYLIFSDNETSLRNYIHNLVLSSTLDKEARFRRFNKEMNSSSSLYFYMSFSKMFNIKSLYLAENAQQVLTDNEMLWRKLEGLGWQVSSYNKQILNNLYLRYNPNLREEPQAIWQSKLDSIVAIKPQIVVNHRNSAEKEVMVQDKANNLYLINKDGVRLWKVKLSANIISDVHQIDIYNNGRLQYVFNTNEKLYIIDRNGNNVQNFPVTLRANATNGVSVFDYNKDSNYRFFIACDNKQTYAYDKKGNVVMGWKAVKTDALVTNPIQHGVLEGKDYIYYTDLHNTYILDRRGDSRIEHVEKFEHSNNNIYWVKNDGRHAIATTDAEGIIHFQYVDGGHKTVKFAKFGANHFFVAYDLNQDGEEDYVFAARNVLVAFTSKGKQIFERKFSSNITNCPNVYNFGAGDIRIGVTCSGENQIYLVTLDGNNYDGFPLFGNTDFSIGNMTSGNAFFNLLVGNNDNSFLNYMIE